MDSWVIYTASVDLMYDVFMGIRFIFDLGSSFYGILGAAAIIGLFVGYIKTWIDPKEKPVVKWVFTLIVVLLSLRATVDVELDDNSDVAVVSDVPVVVAITPYIFSHIRYSLENAMANAFGLYAGDSSFDPTTALSVFQEVNFAQVATLNPWYYYSTINYFIDCFNRDVETFGESAGVKPDKLFNSTPNDFWDNAKVNYSAWETKIHNADGTTQYQTCPNAWETIKNYGSSAELQTTFEQVLGNKGSKINYLQKGLDDIAAKAGAAGVSAYKALLMQFVKGIYEQSVTSDSEFQYALQKFQATKSSNAKSVWQYVFSARNTQMFMLFLELLAVIVVPILLVIALMTNKFETLALAGMFSFIPLVTSITYVPMKMMMYYFYLNNVGLEGPLTWVQMGNTIEDAESAVASAAALSLMIPSLITIIANKMFQGASAAGSALSAANRQDVDTGASAPKIASAPDLGKVSFGNYEAITNTAAGLAGIAGPAFTRTTSGDSVYQQTVSSRNDSQVNSSYLAAKSETSSASQNVQAASNKVLSDMRAWDSAKGTERADSTQVSDNIKFMEQVAEGASTTSGIDERKAQEVLTQAIALSGIGGSLTGRSTLGTPGEAFLGSGASVTAQGGVKFDWNKSNIDKDTLLKAVNKGKSTNEQMSASELDEMMNALAQSYTKTERVSSSDKASVNDSVSDLYNAGYSFGQAQSNEERLAKTLSQTNSDNTSFDVDVSRGAYQAAIKGLGSTDDILAKAGISVEEGRVIMENNGFSGSMADFLKQEKARFSENRDSNIALKNMDDKAFEQMANMYAVNKLFSTLEGNRNTSSDGVTQETTAMKNIARVMEEGTGEKAYGQMKSRFEEIEQILSGGKNAVAKELDVDTQSSPDGAVSPNSIKKQVDNDRENITEDVGIRAKEVDGKIDATDINAIHQQNNQKVVDAKDNSDVINHVKQQKEMQSIGADTPEAAFNKKLIDTNIAKQHDALNSSLDKRYNEMREGINTLATSNDILSILENGITSSATNEQKEQLREVLSAMGTEGKAWQDEMTLTNNPLSNQMNANADIVSSWLQNKDNQAAVIDNADGLAAVLSTTQGDNFSMDHERALVAYADGQNTFSPEYSAALQEIHKMEQGLHSDLDSDKPLVTADRDYSGITGYLEGSFRKTGEDFIYAGNLLERATGVDPVESGINYVESISRGHDPNNSLNINTPVTSSEFIDKLETGILENYMNIARSTSQDNAVEKTGDLFRKLPTAMVEDVTESMLSINSEHKSSEEKVLAAAKQVIANEEYTSNTLSVLNDKEGSASLRGVADLLNNNGYREDANKIYDVVGKLDKKE